MMLPWISHENLLGAVSELLDRAHTALGKVEHRKTQNVIDPFATLVLSETFSITDKNVLSSLLSSSLVTHTISQAVGKFHQRVLGSVQGCKNHDAGYDLILQEKHCIAEIKNKHNTMNASNREKVIADLDTAVRQKGKGWKGYLVIILPKTPLRYETKISTVSRDVFEIDGASFYAKVTQEHNALYQLFENMPALIKKVSKGASIAQEILAYTNHLYKEAYGS